MAGFTPIGSPTAPQPGEEEQSGDTTIENRVSPDEGGLLGFFTNAWRDTKDIAGGLWKLGGSVVHDVSTGIGDLADLDPGEGDYVMDNMANAIFGTGEYSEMGSVLLNDYQQRYGSEGLAGGNLNVLYESPLSFIGDALTVVTGGGAAAAKGAQLAGKVGLVGKAATAAKVVDTASDVGRLGKLSSVVKAIEGSAKRLYNPLTGKVEVVSQATNPARRLLYQDNYLKLTSVKGAYAEAKAAKYAELAEKGGAMAVRYSRKRDLYRKAAEAAMRTEFDRVLKPGWAAQRARRFVDKTVGVAAGKTGQVADAIQDSFDRNFGKVGDQVVSDDELVDAFQGVNTDLTGDDLVAPQGTGLRRAEVFAEEGPATVKRGDTRWTIGQKVETTEEFNRRVMEGDVTDGGGIAEPRLPATGTEHRGAFDQALEKAHENVRTLTPKLRQAFGKDAKVIPGEVKAEAAIRTKAELLGGTWRDVEDISRFRVIAEDAWDATKSQSIIDNIEKTTGGKVLKVENSINNPMPDGSRQLRVVVEVDGNPVEFQVLTPEAAKVFDATKNLRNQVNTAAMLGARGAGNADFMLRLEKAQRISQQLWEGVADEIRVRRGGPAPAELRARMNRFRVDVFAHATDPLLGRGLDINSVFDNAYMPLRYKHGARFDADAMNGKGAMQGGPSPLQLDDAMAQAGEMAPVYYPLMDAARLPKRGDFMRRGAPSATRGIAQDQNLQRNTGRLLAEARYSKDARKVWRVRAAQTARMQEHVDMLYDVVAEYGRPVQSIDDIGVGEELFAPGLVKQLQKEHNALLDELANDPSGRGLRDLLKKLSADNVEQMRQLLENKGDIEAFAVPKEVAKRLRAHAPLGIMNNVDIVFGTPTRLWKTMTLAGRPAWMVNNLFSNALFLKLQGGKLTDVLRQIDRGYLRELRENLEGVDGVEGGMYSAARSGPRAYDGDGFIDGVADFMQRNVAQSRPGNRLAKMADWVQSVNSGMEDAFRRASYLTAAEKATVRRGVQTTSKSFWRSKQRLERAFLSGLDEPTWREAVDEVNKYLNDYNDLSPLGRQVLRPYVTPFYAFYRHAAKLLVTMPFEHPAKSRLFALVQEADEERMKMEGLDYANLPGWMKSDMLFTGRGEAGDFRFMSGGGLNPFNSVMDTPLNTMHPAWKVIYEQGTGRSTFTGEEFTDSRTVTGGFGTDSKFRIGPDGQPVPVDTVQPGLLEHLLQQVPQYEMVKDVIAGGRTYDTSTLIDVLQYKLLGQGDNPVPLNPETGEPWKEVDAMKTLAKLFGWSESDYDAAAMAERTLDQKQAALKAWADRQSIERVEGTTAAVGSGFTPGG
jgi:hypothetical protein